MATNPKPSEGFENAVDIALNVLRYIQNGGSLNITSGPYLSGVTVAPAATAASFPWLPLIGLGLGVVLLSWVVSS